VKNARGAEFAIISSQHKRISERLFDSFCHFFFQKEKVSYKTQRVLTPPFSKGKNFIK
jgi:hypothetical protein